MIVHGFFTCNIIVKLFIHVTPFCAYLFLNLKNQHIMNSIAALLCEIVFGTLKYVVQSYYEISLI